MHALQRALTPYRVMRWPLLVLLCVMSAQAENLVPGPAVAHRDWTTSVARGLSLDGSGDNFDVAAAAGLTGFWEHQSQYGSITLEIVSSSRIVVSGQPMSYELAPGVIRLLGEFDEIEYRYQLADNRLILTLTTGQDKPQDITFRRVSLSESEPYSPSNDSGH